MGRETVTGTKVKEGEERREKMVKKRDVGKKRRGETREGEWETN